MIKPADSSKGRHKTSIGAVIRKFSIRNKSVPVNDMSCQVAMGTQTESSQLDVESSDESFAGNSQFLSAVASGMTASVEKVSLLNHPSGEEQH